MTINNNGNCLVRSKKEKNWSSIYFGLIVGRKDTPLRKWYPSSVGGASLPRNDYGGRAMNGIFIGIFYGSSIAVIIHSLDPSLISQLITHYPFA